MFDRTVEEVARTNPDLRDLIDLLGRLAGRSHPDIVDELRAHLAARIAFLLLGLVEGASSFDTMKARLAKALQDSPIDVGGLAEALASVVVNIESAETGRRAGLFELPHPTRARLLASQSHRCGVCGWDFRSSLRTRTERQAAPSLDHRVPFRLGGDATENMWILCGLCNSIKQAFIHVGEHGPIWTDNFVYWGNIRSVAFWVMLRDKRCREPGCGAGSTDGRLYVVRRLDSGPWTFDSCTTRCKLHLGRARHVQY